MIITISGVPGSGKSTAAKSIAKKLKLKHYSTGGYYREMAEKRGLSVLALARLAEKDCSIDRELDEWQTKLGKDEDNFIIDARLGFHFIPHSVKIYLDADETTRAKRIFNDKVRKEKNITLDETLKKMRMRERSEKERFIKYYKINPNDKKHYNLVLDTTGLSKLKVLDKITSFLKKR